MNPFRIRVVVSLLMLGFGLLGVIVTDVTRGGAWIYWRALCILYALLSLGLSWHLRRTGWKTSLFTLWHEVAHWIGLLGAVGVTSYVVQIGLLGRFEAGLFLLLLLALATYLAGVYTEPTLVIIGIFLGGFAISIAFLDEYLYNIILPGTLLAGILVVVLLHRSHKHVK